MIDLNWSLRKAYYNALSDIPDAAGTGYVPVYYFAAPPNKNMTEYIVYRSITNKDESTKSSSDTRTFIIVEIYTKQMNTNPGKRVDEIAAAVYDRVYPNQNTHLQIEGGQIVTTQMTFELVNPYNVISGEVYLSRFLTFKHIIYQTSD
jgi:hypothetical protein